MNETWILEINGAERPVPPVQSVAQLLHYLGVSPDRVAVEINRKIVRRKDWDVAPLRDQDKVEIVQFVGGG